MKYEEIKEFRVIVLSGILACFMGLLAVEFGEWLIENMVGLSSGHTLLTTIFNFIFFGGGVFFVVGLLAAEILFIIDLLKEDIE